MFTVFMDTEAPEYIYFVNSDHFEQAVKDRGIAPDWLLSQELSLEQLVRLKDRDYNVFTLCLR